MTITVSQAAERCHNGFAQATWSARPVRKPRGVAITKVRGTSMTEDPEDMSRLIGAVARVQDVAAFETLFRHFGPRVKAYMMRHTRNLQTAEELMQETMMLVWNKATLFDPEKGNASTWIFTIARNTFISAYRKQNRPEFDPNDPAFVPDDVEPADVEFQNRQEAEMVRTALQDLPAEQRELVQRSFFGDVSHSDLAAEYGLPLGTVKSRIRMAIDKLRKSLGERR
ncbi:sigma-70 family RNA polymerase sigma factor [Labrenzia aggregata]|uniref:Sigma-70 family RNA polymerase sigma factor n=2 Tax=Roseibium aggregatum TaxID=187304 RepID=A0A926S698_9HYPH|nr:sigma-70 family RNA polymerase sigma factor [Roseibium aggregatum]